ncbi:hypothetical protein JTB14_002264 [Gonioctena quinquepunctata]|nr:hypothetical protein JTB14_002264 [Gonioctena quinquepunctata]
MEMKNFVAIIVLCFGVAVQAELLSEEQKAKIIQLHKECLEETKVDLGIAMKAAQGEYTNDEKLKKQILCFNKKVGLQDKNGDIVMEVAKAKLKDIVKDDKKVEEVMKKCVLKKETPEETAFQAAKCLHELAPDQRVM